MTAERRMERALKVLLGLLLTGALTVTLMVA